jgi:hypothetical protein
MLPGTCSPCKIRHLRLVDTHSIAEFPDSEDDPVLVMACRVSHGKNRWDASFLAKLPKKTRYMADVKDCLQPVSFVAERDGRIDA